MFEASFLYLAPDHYGSPNLTAALFAYRAIYYFLPLAAAGAALLFHEARVQDRFRRAILQKGLQKLEPFVPQVLSILILFGGSVLLLSGAPPGELDRLSWLHFFLPLPMIEFSHLAGSLAGVAMLFLARAVWLRVDSAYYAALAMLGLGAAEKDGTMRKRRSCSSWRPSSFQPEGISIAGRRCLHSISRPIGPS